MPGPRTAPMSSETASISVVTIIALIICALAIVRWLWCAHMNGWALLVICALNGWSGPAIEAISSSKVTTRIRDIDMVSVCYLLILAFIVLYPWRQRVEKWTEPWCERMRGTMPLKSIICGSVVFALCIAMLNGADSSESLFGDPVKETKDGARLLISAVCGIVASVCAFWTLSKRYMLAKRHNVVDDRIPWTCPTCKLSHDFHISYAGRSIECVRCHNISQVG